MSSPLLRRILAVTLFTLPVGLSACVGSGDPEAVASASAALGSAAQPSDAPAASAPMSCANSGQRFHCKGLIRTDVQQGFVPEATAPAGYGPADLASAYGLNAALKPNALIAIVDAFGYPNAESDLAAYRSKYALPACTVASGCLTIVNQNGQKSPLPPAPPANDDWTVETALDLDMASAACPNCKLLLVQANDDTSDGLLLAQAAAANLGATVISNSWGGPETAQQTGQSQETFFNLGKPVTIFVAAGDSGYDNAGAGPDYPSTSAYVIGVGGTRLQRSTAGGTRGWVETAWATAPGTSGAGGSSCSISVPKPSYQTSLTTACTFRAASDVAAVGDPATGLAVYNAKASTTGWIVVGGTSAASPLVAGIFALYGHGAAGPTFPYANTPAFYDVTSGSNGTCGNVLCNAGKGWDGPTGVGTPNGTLLGGGAPVPPDMAPPRTETPDMATAAGNATGSGSGTGGGNGATTGGSGQPNGGGSTSSTSGSGGGFTSGGCAMASAAPASGGGLFALAFALALIVVRRHQRSLRTSAR